jgi:hypothetical protein
MNIAVLLEVIDKNGYRATSLGPASAVAEGATREAAIQRLRTTLQEKLANAELVQVQVPHPSDRHPWKELAASWSEHPDAAEFERHLQEYRIQVDSDPQRL